MNAKSESGGTASELTCNFISVLGAPLLSLPVLVSTKLASKLSSSFALDKSWHIFTASEAAFGGRP